jgi:hypothetical protein
MEHKWALYHHRGSILCIRSWLRQVVAVAEVRTSGVHAEVVSVRGALTAEDEEPAFTVRLLDYLIRSHALDLVWPAPLPDGLEAEPKAAALWCFTHFGNRAYFATPHLLPADVPERPLRTHSLLHIAVARGDLASAGAQLAGGVPVDLLARDGLSPLHWALEPEAMEFLLARGCPVDVRSAEGATPLMNAVQSRNAWQVALLLDRGADPNAADERGFTALHRAAEMGEREVVEMLLRRGAAPNPEAQGHSPASLAAKRGETAVVELLNRWPG